MFFRLVPLYCKNPPQTNTYIHVLIGKELMNAVLPTMLIALLVSSFLLPYLNPIQFILWQSECKRFSVPFHFNFYLNKYSNACFEFEYLFKKFTCMHADSFSSLNLNCSLFRKLQILPVSFLHHSIFFRSFRSIHAFIFFTFNDSRSVLAFTACTYKCAEALSLHILPPDFYK